MLVLKNREALADLANALDLKTAVEVGTHQAVFASGFMKRFRGTITLIDPWEGYDENPTFYPGFNESTQSRSEDLEIAESVMLGFSERVTFLRSTSEEAALSFKDNSIGIVYVDALHDYESVKKDILIWYKKVQPGGILSGHDFYPTLPGVIQAVLEFAFEENLELNVTSDPYYSWWFIKKEGKQNEDPVEIQNSDDESEQNHPNRSDNSM